MNDPRSIFIINPEELKKKLYLPNIKILDCRWFLNQPQKGIYEYKKSHLPNALYYDLEENSEKNNDLPHMFPSNKKFSNSINKLGISKKDFIVIYDQIGFFCSARIWYIFKTYGFKNIKILNGGFSSWKKKKFPTTKKIPEYKFLNANFKIIKNRIIDKKQIQKMLFDNKKNFKLIDARPEKRFYGIDPEPRKNIKSGNIPGSINIPFNKISDKNGNLLSIKKLRNLFNKEINSKKDDKIVCLCGSGVTACNIILSLDILGYKNINLYDGSWAEWGKE